MKLFIAVLACLAAACVAAALWVLWQVRALYASGGYGSTATPYVFSFGGFVEADGADIYLPVGLLLAVAAFLGKFAWNLWRDERRH